ncbi:MAG TPA: ABC transporter permease [Kineosporiaceae bacterium]|nr:ABC transporter permease [Kineosporiaceae bacterium]
MITVELRKLLWRPRTWISIFLLCLLPTIVAVFLAVTGVGPRPGQGPAFLSAVLANGRLYPAAALGIVLPVFLPLAVAVVAGESIAGEASVGMLRYLLVRPVARTRLLIAKLIAVIAYTLLAVVAVAVSGLVVGVLVIGEQPGGPATVSVSGTSLSTEQLLIRALLMMGYVGWSMLGVASVSLFLSTLTDSALGAALGGIAALVGSTVLVGLDAAGSINAWLPTRYWLAWVDLFRDPILWHDIHRGLLVQALWIIVLLGMAWAAFTARDVSS